MEIVLIPGFWLDGSSWDKVVPALRQAGHHTHALTLPGMRKDDDDRAKVSLRDQVDAAIEVIDSLAPAKVVLVAHSGGGAVAHAAVDARPDRIARVIYAASEPLGEGQSVNDQLPATNGEVPLPDWSFFGDEELADLDDELRATFRDRAIPTPANVTRDLQQLSDERRYDVPVTLIACEYPSSMLRDWIEQGHPGAQELGKIRHVDYVDLPTGHWPQFTRPADLAQVILTSVG